MVACYSTDWIPRSRKCATNPCDTLRDNPVTLICRPHPPPRLDIHNSPKIKNAENSESSKLCAFEEVWFRMIE